MTKYMLDTLEEWLSKNFCPLIETTGTLVCRLTYKSSGTKRDIAIAFSRYYQETDPAEYVVGDDGYVITVPSFWLSIPKELVIPYLTSYIDNYMKTYVFSSGGSSEDTKPSYPPPPTCPPPSRPPANCPRPDKPVCPPPITTLPPNKDCIINAIEDKGYFVDESAINTGTFTNTSK